MPAWRRAEEPDRRQALGLGCRRGEAAHRDRDRPDPPGARVRRTDALAGRAAEPPRVRRREDPPTGGEVDRVVRRARPEVREREEARGVRVVHQDPAAEAVDLVRPDRRATVPRRARRARRPPGSPRRARPPRPTSAGASAAAATGATASRAAARARLTGTFSGSSERIVRRAERAVDHPVRAARSALAEIRHVVRRVAVRAVESVRAGAVESLLGAQGPERLLQRASPLGVERPERAAGVRVSGREAEEREQGVRLPLALVDTRAHLGLVAGPLAGPVVGQERVRVRVEQDLVALAVDDAANQPVEIGIVRDRGEVRPDLRARVAQPHRIDVAGQDERVGSLVGATGDDRRVERVGQRSFEQPAKAGIGDPGGRGADAPLDGIAVGGTVRGAGRSQGSLPVGRWVMSAGVVERSAAPSGGRGGGRRSSFTLDDSS